MGLDKVKLKRDDDTVTDKPIQSIDFRLHALSQENFDSIINQILHHDFDFVLLTASQIKQISDRLILDLAKLLESPECIPSKFILRISELLLLGALADKTSGNDGVQLLGCVVNIYAACVLNQYKSETLYPLMANTIRRLSDNITSSLNLHAHESAKIIIDLSKALDKACSVEPAKFSINRDNVSVCITTACCLSMSHLQSLCSSRVDYITSIVDINSHRIFDDVCKKVEHIHILHRLGYTDYIRHNLEKILSNIRKCSAHPDIVKFLTVYESNQLKSLFYPISKETDDLISSCTNYGPAPRQDTGFIYNGF